MKQSITILFAALWIGAAPATSQAQRSDIYSRPLQAEPVRPYDALHYRVTLRFDEPARSFYGSNVISLRSLEDNLTTIVLDAETFVATAAIDAHNHALTFTQDPRQLRITLKEPAARGDTIHFAVTYHAEDVDVDATAYGMPASYDLGLGFKQPTDENPQLINTLSFPEGARHWMPCNDHPQDRATNETLVTVRKDYQVLSNGRLASVTDHDNGEHTFHWIQQLPHPTYLYVMVAGPYVVLKDSLGSLPVNYWVYPQDVDDAMRSFERTPEILQYLTDLYGTPYPWVKYDQITIPGIGGGAESTTATVLGQSTIHDEAAHQDFPSDWLVAHEAAHQWWGNLVSYRHWSETWLSESFATYSEYRWAAHAHGPDEGALNLLRKKEAYFAEAASRYRRPVVFRRWEFPSQNFDRHTYQKGAAILAMLTDLLGDAHWERTMQHFLSKHAFEPVTTPDLMTAVQEATGQDLDWFFEQWIYRPGHPVLEASSTWDEAQMEVTVHVAQVQDTTGGTPVAYRMPVTLRIEATGDRIQRETVWLTARTDSFSFALPGAPLMVRFDENDVLLAEWVHTKSHSELQYQLTHDNAMGRARAAGMLAAHAAQPSVRTSLMESARNDPFWYVRATSITALGSEASVAFLKERCLDVHSRVRAAALRSLGASQDVALAEFFKERFARDDSYVARAEALRSLARTGAPHLRRFLEAARNISSPRNVIGAAAAWVLEQL